MSDLESGELFQAWRGFKAPVSPDLDNPSIKRSLSAHSPGSRPRIAVRSATIDGDLGVEVVSNGHMTPVPQLSQTRHLDVLDTSGTIIGGKDGGAGSKSGGSSLAPSPANSRSSSPQPKITYLSEVVKENERRLSLTSNRSA